jgi:clan AA aspartic protease (TIGR02281 family)
MRRFPVVCVLLTLAGTPALAQSSPADWIAAQGKGCLLWNPHPTPKETVTWSGTCPELLAQGQGAVQWFQSDAPGIGVEGTYRQGHLISGVVSYPNGDRYEGDLRDGERTGKGVYRFASGNRYEGQFSHGDRNGQGVFTWANGDRYVGEFRDGYPWGHGTYRSAAGVRQEGEWNRNRFVQPSTAASGQPALRREIALVRTGGILTAPVTINGTVTLPFVIDSGASVVTISSEVFQGLVAAKAITTADMRGSHQVRLADGSQRVQPVFLIRSLTVGDLTVKDVVGSVSKAAAPLLLGQSFLGRFRSWSVDNSRQVLVLQ